MSRLGGGNLALAGAIVAMAATTAQACTTLPNQLANGSTADAGQVMADFNGIVSCPLFTGFVGIGTTAPQTLLSVGNNVPGTSEPTYHGLIQIDGNSDLTSGNNGLEFKTSVFGSGFGWLITAPDRNNGNAPLSFASRNNASAWTERLTLRSDSGDVGIGTPNPTHTLEVNGTAFSSGGWSSPSDARLKRDVVEIHNALELVERLRGVRFQWRAANERQVGKSLLLPVGAPELGLIAQEVKSVVPEAVSSQGDGGLLALKEGELVPLLIEAIKEQQAEIDELKQARREIEDLSAKVASLKAQRSNVAPIASR